MLEKAVVTLTGKAVVVRHENGEFEEIFVPMQGRVNQATVKEVLPEGTEILSIKAGKVDLEIPISEIDKYIVK